jgi:hypothetical protein
MDLTELLVALLTQKPNQPLSTFSAIAAVFVPSGLLIVLAKPDLLVPLDFSRVVLLAWGSSARAARLIVRRRSRSPVRCVGVISRDGPMRVPTRR